MDSISVNSIEDLLSVRNCRLEDGFTYLGFFLKPNSYNRTDWEWLLKKVQHRISRWSSNWLSLGGRLTPLNSVLQSILFFWFGLFKVPICLLVSLR